MHTLKLSVSLPDATHAAMELRLSADDSPCDVVIALPTMSTHVTALPRPHDTESPDASDDYVLGGYAGI